ncbi:helix-turn-helix transcriptional regulator [Ottowia sp. GY511]|uniref:Helix-turn-helix transcriptional regulator n=1 Tax=Ottowia flava TaxID=2675430 RepID=A0ABW4KQT4_9BURK|nr:helix-turn-helix transcriptional regulator [Ottowia sp. GY511]TXK33130.1 helix-turn-helix transcriptional regulator [Ottowia sp. GY511]
MPTGAPEPEVLSTAAGAEPVPATAAEDEVSLAAFDRVQTALYRAVGADAAWSDALQVIAQEFDASFSMLVAAGQGQRDQSFYAAWNHPEAAARAYSDHWWQHDLWLQQGVARGLMRQGNIMRGSDLVPPAVLRASPFYRDYLATLPAEHLLVCLVSDGRTPGMAPPSHLSFFRRPTQPDFSTGDVARLRRLYPHVLRAFDLHWSTRRLEDQVTLLHRFLDAFDFGLLMLDPAAAVTYANQTARELSTQPTLARWLGSLPQRVQTHEPLGKLVRSCARGQGGGRVLGERTPELIALALPVGGPTDQPGACMLLLTTYAQMPSSALDFVIRTFGLSQAEARLLPLLLHGHSPADIAADLGVKLSTVRTQLSAIFAKTGAMRQQDLIRLLGSVPPVRLLEKSV